MGIRELTVGERRLVQQARVARLSTVGADGAPHAIPVCPALVDGRIVIGLEGGTRKDRNISGDPRVAVLFDDYVEDWDALRGVLISGTATYLADPAERATAIDALYAKFTQYPEIAAFDADDPMIAVEPTSIASGGFG